MTVGLTVYLWILVPLAVFATLAVSVVLAGWRFNRTAFRGRGTPDKSCRGLFVNVVAPAAPVELPAAAGSPQCTAVEG